ncbi:hypothetical protein BRC60_07105 [Halobacteriales archaeon QH_1_68_42]|nr:MAG: hypothetical protein BRC60_07105 [Halobacteriales archaeon QH_1_68_42]
MSSPLSAIQSGVVTSDDRCVSTDTCTSALVTSANPSKPDLNTVPGIQRKSWACVWVWYSALPTVVLIDRAVFRGQDRKAGVLAERGLPDHEQYAAWIEMYSGEEFTELAEWCRDLMDDVAAGTTAADRERYRDLFLTSSRYEYMFWDAAWRQEEWPV